MGWHVLEAARRFHIYFFADDSLLFYNATMEECTVLLEKLWWYEKASGQLVNTDKTSLFFSSVNFREGSTEKQGE